MADKEERLKVLLCHANENKPIVQELSDRLKAAGFEPWLDSNVAQPGMNRDIAIQEAMDTCDAVILCLSSLSLMQEGYFHKELRLAQERQMEMPEKAIFLIPLRLDDCATPFSLRNIEWADYRNAADFEKVVSSLNIRARQLGRSPGRLARPKKQAQGDPQNQGETQGALSNIQAAVGMLNDMIQQKGDFEFGDDRSFTDKLDAQLAKLHAAVRALNSNDDLKRPLGIGNPYYFAIGAAEKLQDFVKEVRRKDMGSEDNTKELKVRLRALEAAVSDLAESSGVSPKAGSAAPEGAKRPEHSKKRTRPPTRRQPLVDVVILTVLRDEYLAVCGQLPDLQIQPGTRKYPNLYAWKTGTVLCEAHQSSYRVMVGMTGRPGNQPSALAASEAIDLWEPQYIFFSGIAGGLIDFKKAAAHKGFEPDIHLGDVVIADIIHGYDYGKIEVSYQPRDNWTYETDLGLWTSAIAYKNNPAWRQRIGIPPPQPCQPTILYGEIASGDKVVDNPSNAFFARVYRRWPKAKAVEMEGSGVGAAINQAKSKGKNVGFLMIRGISDIPRPPQSSAVLQNVIIGRRMPQK